jgi:hypothetical protein
VALGLAPHLPADQRPGVLTQGLAAATAITGEYARAQALTELAPHLPTNQRRGVILEALSEERDSTEWFIPGKRRVRSRRTTDLNFAITDDVFHAHVRAALAPQQPWFYEFTKTEDAATAGTYDYSVARAIKTLAPHLPADLLDDALAAATAMTRPGDRAEALAALVPHMPAHQQSAVLAKALSAITAITDITAEVLTALVPHLPAALLAEALAAASSGSIYSAQPLIALAPRLPPELLTEALAAALETDHAALTAVLERASAVLMPSNGAALLDLLRTALDARNDRPTCPDIIATTASAIAQLGGVVAVQACVQAICDVHRWWP